MIVYGPSQLVIKKMFADMLSSAGALLHEYYESGEQIRIIISDEMDRVQSNRTYKRLQDVPEPLYRGPLKPNKFWKASIALSQYVRQFGTVYHSTPVSLQVEARNGLTMQRFKVQNARAVKLARKKLARVLQKPRKPVGRGMNTRPLRASPETVYISHPHYYENQTEGLRWFTYIPKLSFYREWTGVRTPNFFSLKKRKRPYNSHHSYSIRHQDGNACQLVSGGPANNNLFILDSCWDTVALYTGCAYPGTAVHDSSLRNRTISKLKVEADVETANVAQDLFQVNEITRMTVDTVGRVVSCLRALSKHNFDAARLALVRPRRVTAKNHRGVDGYTVASESLVRPYLRQLFNSRPSTKRSLAENWLEMQYGWKPLLADIHDVVEKLAKANYADVVVQRVKATSVSETRQRTRFGHADIPSSATAGFRYTKKKTTHKMTIAFRVDDHLLAFLNQTGFTNPVNLAWELLPWSFVVDWFLPIGQFFEGITAWQGLTFVSGSETTFTYESTSICADYLGKMKAPWSPLSDCRLIGNMFSVAARLDRVKLTSFPLQSLPRYKNPFSCVHGLNAIALLQSAFTGTGRTFLNK